MTSAFYENRHLSEPTRQIRPESADQLCEAIDDLEADGTDYRLIGDGQHVRGDTDSVVVRTGEIDDVLDLDTESGVVRVGAGTCWKQLRAAVGEADLTLQRYGLVPPTATVGGLLARRRTGPHLMRGGEVLDGCNSVGAHHPNDGDYRYLVAPRKASGPDLRYDFVGAEGRGGAILDATLVVWPAVDARLVRFEDCTPVDAARIVDELFETVITPTWIHYSSGSEVLQFGLAAPGQLLRARVRLLADRVGQPDVIGDAEDCRSRKQWLESRHPDRRAAPDAERTRVFQIVPGALTEDLEQLFGPGAESLEIPIWTPRRATAFVRYDDVDRLEEAADAVPDGTCWATWSVVA